MTGKPFHQPSSLILSSQWKLKQVPTQHQPTRASSQQPLAESAIIVAGRRSVIDDNLSPHPQMILIPLIQRGPIAIYWMYRVRRLPDLPSTDSGSPAGGI